MEYDDISDLNDSVNYRLGLGASVGYLSIIGPIAVSMSWDSQRKDIIGNINIGFYF
jgi:outer membrane translocation and assembly module TamA